MDDLALGSTEEIVPAHVELACKNPEHQNIDT
jgi:hypothetical protein